MFPYGTLESKASLMSPRRYDAMWCVIMFDLPVQTKLQRKEASKFRKMLVDAGYSMIQFSVYGKYSPTTNGNMSSERSIKQNLPADGEVRMFHLTDSQWASATRFRAKKIERNEEAPDQITLF